MKNIKNLIGILFLFVWLSATLVSCKSSSVVLPTTTETTNNTITKIVVRDTVFVTQKDSSYYKAFLECKNGVVLLKPNPTIKKGKYLQPPKIIIKNNYIEVDCEAENQKLFAQWKDVYRENMKSIINTKVVEVERQLTFFQNAQIWLGRILLLLILALVTTSILKNKNII